MRFVARCAVLCFVASPLAAQRGAFIVQLGTDTLFVEQYRASASALEGDEVARSATVTTVRHFAATLDRHGNVMRYELAGRPAANPGAPPQTLRVNFEADTAVVTLTLGDSSRSERLWLPGGAIPLVTNSYALLELVTRRALAAGRLPQVVPVLSLARLAPEPATVSRGTGDSVVVVVGDGVPVRVRVDSSGRILGASAVGTTEQFTVARVAGVDIPALAREFAMRPLGQLSPPDSVHAVVGGAEIAIAYSRPAMRGRKIFGGLVPWNQVWRTGANAATRFTTSAELVMGGTTIPRGSYSLWTLPTPTGWKLILNRQTRAACTGEECASPTRAFLWGTDYSADSDFARLDMRVEPLAEPVERFTIAVVPQGADGGLLTLAWERTRASIPFVTKR